MDKQSDAAGDEDEDEGMQRSLMEIGVWVELDNSVVDDKNLVRSCDRGGWYRMKCGDREHQG